MTDNKKKFLDLKIPLGALLTFYGIILTLYGIFTKPAMYEKSFGVDINLLWGFIILILGGSLLFASFIKRK